MLVSAPWEATTPPAVLVALPAMGPTTVTWAQRFAGLQYPVSYHSMTYIGMPIDQARNVLVRQALKLQCRWILFIDTDVLVPKDALVYMMGHRWPVVSGLYYSKAGTYCAWNEHPLLPRKFAALDPGLVENNEVLMVDAVGAGILLVETRVFEMMKPPWFYWERDPEDPQGISEDLYWCHRLKTELGLPVLLDNRVKCEHESIVAYSPKGTVEKVVK